MTRLTALSSVIIITYFSMASSYHHHLHTGISLGDDAEGCQKAMKRAAAIDGATITLDSPSAIHGRWVSEGCETRPGPEFLLRSYTFHTNNTFKLVQYYYTEDSCSTPGYTVVARGKLLPHDGYFLTTVSVIPNSNNVAHHLAAKINSTCPGLVRKRWKPLKEYFILNLSDDYSYNHRSNRSLNEDIYRGIRKHHRAHYVEKFNCLRALTLVFHELHHYKVQIRPGLNGNFKTTHLRQELLLGDIHSKLNSRADYKPTSFQVPLLRIDSSIADTLGIDSASFIKGDSLLNIDSKSAEETEHRVYQKSYIGHFDVGTVGELDSILSSKRTEKPKTDKNSKDADIFKHCHICSAIASSNEKSPPYLMTKVPLPLQLSGEWVSLQCEQRPMHIYLTRHFRFYPGDRTWIMEYKFYYDAVCTGASFSVTAAGHYKIGKGNMHVSGGTEVDFNIERASLTVYDQRMIENLEQDSDCGFGEWRLGIPREMSSTNGCPTLGLVVPSVEYELLKLDVDFYGFSMLYMGQPDTEGKRRNIKDRPTAYELPLVQCKNLPSYSENLREILSSPLHGDGIYSSYEQRILAMETDNLYSSGNVKTINLFIFIYTILFILLR